VAFLVVLGALVSAGPALADASVTVGSSTGYYNSYFPPDVTINAGEKVTWNWAGGLNSSHSVTADGGSFDSMVQSPGSSFMHTFTSPGTYTYYCLVHGHAMSGTVHVLGAGGPPAPKITNVRIKPKTLCTKQSKLCKHPGAKLRFALSEAAKVQLVVMKKGTTAVLSRLTVNGKAGKSSFAFPGKGLGPGRYVLTLTATSGGQSSNPAKVRFRVRKS
jgi:plastocyanin